MQAVSFQNKRFINFSTRSRPMIKVAPRRFKRFPRASLLETLNEQTYYVGKGIILFTMFYCSMNWWYYKNLREKIERDDDNANKTDKAIKSNKKPRDGN